MNQHVVYDLKLQLSHYYAGPTAGARHVVHVAPLTIAGRQNVQSLSVNANPVSNARGDLKDYFGNLMTQFSHLSSHNMMQIEMKARVTCLAQDDLSDASVSLADLPREIRGYKALDAAAPHHFLGLSPRIMTAPDVAEYSRAIVQPGGSTLAAFLALGRSLHQDMSFDSMATTVDTPLDEAFRKRRGVCQDFAHILIAGLRSLGIPARYVSGFVRTEPPEGQERLEGADAMHAWVAAWCGPKMGWVEYDPTNDVTAKTDHIVVGYGRDYSDVAPIKGVLRASGVASVGQAVDVVPVLA